MNMQTLNNIKQDANQKIETLENMITWVPRILVPLFSAFFLTFALLYAGSAIVEFVRPIVNDGDLVGGLVKGLHMGVVALAVYELAQVIHQEYDKGIEPADVIRRIRRGITRFSSVVFVALVLESLIMVIKYSQQDLAGFLYYPVAIIMSASLLLIALGVFIKMSSSISMERNPG
jgi:hypothetical protein